MKENVSGCFFSEHSVECDCLCHSSVNHFHRDRGLYAVCMLCVKAGRYPAGVQYIGVH